MTPNYHCLAYKDADTGNMTGRIFKTREKLDSFLGKVSMATGILFTLEGTVEMQTYRATDEGDDEWQDFTELIRRLDGALCL
jgi:hypothetical protein